MTAPSTLRASLLGRCPRCGQGRLFDGYLAIAPSCSACCQDFRSFDVGDGAAALVILVVGAIVCGPPLWVHTVLWAPVIALLTLFLLRVTKSALLVLQYRHKAGEGRIVG